jgi:hypothetical protein
MWTTLGARQGAWFARLRDLLRRTSPSAILDGDEADAELIDAWLLHVGLGLPESLNAPDSISNRCDTERPSSTTKGGDQDVGTRPSTR